MNQVLKGKQLNPVDPEKRNQRTHNAPAAQVDPRTALMNQIKAGVKLKTVSQNQSKPEPTEQPSIAVGGLAGALAKALQQRGKVIQPSDDESSANDDDDEDEWDDAN